jgi:hypothetical protein
MEVKVTTMVRGGVKETIFFILKVPRKCPLVLLVGVKLMFRINSKL